MYRQIIIPDEKDHSIELPPELYGKRVEIIVIEIGKEKGLPAKKEAEQQFLGDLEFIPDFPSIEEIRNNAWPSKW